MQSTGTQEGAAYPLRAFVAGVAAPLLRLGGYAVVQKETCLNWVGRLIWVGAPCSGIRMLWVEPFIACTFACLYELRPFRSVLALGATFVVILLRYVLRASALFYIEAGLVAAPPWAHDYVGVVSFAMIASFVLITIRQIGRIGRCDIKSSTPEHA